jgi:hypothetical protein
MDTISPALADAYALLRQDLYEHLDEAECLGLTDDWTAAEQDSAHRLIADLVVVIRGMLAGHTENTRGTCTKCSTGWPCDVVSTIHRLVKDPDNEFARILRKAHESATRER